MYPEIQTGNHNAEGKEWGNEPNPFFAVMESGGEEDPRAHLRVSAGERLCRVQIQRGQERVIDFHPRYEACQVRAKAVVVFLCGAIDSHRGEGGHNQAFPKFFIQEPIDCANKCYEESRFPEE